MPKNDRFLARIAKVGLSRQRSWCVSTDPEFVAKAADIVGLYLNPPENALVISKEKSLSGGYASLNPPDIWADSTR
ncbi:MAG: putative transposase [Candidatus Brocadiaceae bacterium]|nr:putative transposase [Candidatus Brocadiaceae bacterium]